MAKQFWLLVCSVLVGPPLLWADVHIEETETWYEEQIYRDNSASGDKTVVHIFRKDEQEREKKHGQWRDKESMYLEVAPELPSGAYEVTLYVTARPVELMHRFTLRYQANGVARRVKSASFNSSGDYIPLTLQVQHNGGPLKVELGGFAFTGFDGMRSTRSGDEQAALKALESETKADLIADGEEELPDDDDGGLDELEGTPKLSTLHLYDLYIAWDRCEFRRVADLPAQVTRVWVDKVHYLPETEVKAEVDVRAERAGAYSLTVVEVQEDEQVRVVHEAELKLDSETQTVRFTYQLGKEHFGRQLLAILSPPGTKPALTAANLGDPLQAFPGSNFEVFGVSKNVYEIGISCLVPGLGSQHLDEAFVKGLMAFNKANYANYYERFAWAPCDYSNLTPKDELFWSGQGQYACSKSKIQMEIREAHDVGIKVITYGKMMGGGIEGFRMFRRRPHYFLSDSINGMPGETHNAFFLERMIAKEHDGWQRWMWVTCDWDDNDEVVDYGADEIMRSVEMFGWDGVRWDGHFVNKMARFKARVNAKYPNFVHGYNICFADPGSKLFMPRQDRDDFHECARGGGLMMDESARDYSHTNWAEMVETKGRPWFYYEAVCREGDYVRRVEGLPLVITFDMWSHLDNIYNHLFVLAAGQIYTYHTSPGHWPYGNLTKWLTRYSAYIWCPAKRLAKPKEVITLTPEPVEGLKEEYEFFWHESVWIRDVSPAHKQLLLRIVNPPRYPQFCDRAQPPSLARKNVGVEVSVPPGIKVASVIHASPDLPTGHDLMSFVHDAGTCKLTIPEINTFSVVVLNLHSEAGEFTSEPFALTTPIKDGDAYRQTEEGQAQVKKLEEQAIKAAIARSQGLDKGLIERGIGYDERRNFDAEDREDPELIKRLEDEFRRPNTQPSIHRNGILDLHHCRGIYAWLNKVDYAFGLVGGGRHTVSWLDRYWYKGVCHRNLDEFPDSYPELFTQDVLVMDNIHAYDMGLPRRIMIHDYVRSGGGLLIFGGYFNLSAGLDHRTMIQELIPVDVKGFQQFAIDETRGHQLAPVDKGFFSKDIDWSDAPAAFYVDRSPLQERAKVLLKAGDHPAIVSHTVGKGRVIVVMMNPHGEAPGGVQPYWEWAHWPRVVGDCVKWLAGDYRRDDGSLLAKKVANPKFPDPESLLVEAPELSAAELIEQMTGACENVLDAETALNLLTCVVDNIDKIQDLDVLRPVFDAVEPFVDASFVDQVEQLMAQDVGPIKAMGLRTVGLAKQRQYLADAQAAMANTDEEIQHAAVAALGDLGDPKAVPAIKAYVEADGQFKFLAASQLVKLGAPGAFTEVLPLYSAHQRHVRDLKCRRMSVTDSLYGATSFKNTIKKSRKLKRTLAQVKKRENWARQDMANFEAMIYRLPKAQIGPAIESLAASDREAVVPLLLAILGRLDEQEQARYVATLQNAKLPTIRKLVGK